MTMSDDANVGGGVLDTNMIIHFDNDNDHEEDDIGIDDYSFN